MFEEPEKPKEKKPSKAQVEMSVEGADGAEGTEGEGYEEEVVKSLIGGLMPGILVSYRNDTLGGFGKEIVRSLKA